jgi:hypothetical protein
MSEPVKGGSVKARKEGDKKRGISGTVDKEDFINLKTLLLQSGETLEHAITRMVKNFIMKGGKLE